MRTYKKTRLRRIVDGDTIDVVVDLGFRVTTEVRVRLIGVDTPERGEDGYHDAIGILHDLMFKICDEDGCFVMSTAKTGKYGRWLAYIDGVTDELGERWPYPKEK